MTSGASKASMSDLPATPSGGDQVEVEISEHDFKPTGTIFILGMFVLMIILLWLSVYVILLSRGVTTS